MKATVDADLCSGCSLCSATAPEVFEMGDDDVALVIADPVPADAEESAQDAADECPSEAITLA